MTKKKQKTSAIVSCTICLVAILLLLLSLGCSTKNTSTTYRENGFNPAVLKDSNVALGGVVLHNGASLGKLSGVEFTQEELTHTVQANLWSPLLADAFQAKTGNYPTVDWFHFSSRVPLETVEKILDLQARQSIIPPALLEECHNILPHVSFLLMARIDETRLDSTHRGDFSELTSGRQLSMTMDIYDLKSSLAVYTYSVEYFDDGPRSPSKNEIKTTEQKIKLPDSTDGNVGLPGYVIKAPTVAQVAIKCMNELLAPINYVRGGMFDNEF